jgi:hypothetical protein
MAGRPPDPDDDTGVEPEYASPVVAPRWVMVAGIIALVLIVLIIVMLIVGNGHGPRRHSALSQGAVQEITLVNAALTQLHPDEKAIDGVLPPGEITRLTWRFVPTGALADDYHGSDHDQGVALIITA